MEKKTRKPRAKKVQPKEQVVQPKDQVKEQTKLTLGHIQESDTQYDEMVQVDFDDGKYCFIYARFRPSKIQDMLEDLGNFLVEYEKTGRQIKENKVRDYYNLHIIQHFSDAVDEDIMSLNIEQKLDIYKQILDSEYGEKIMESFDKKEIEKAYGTMSKKFEQQMELISKNQELQKQFKEKVASMNLENKDAIMRIIFGDEDNG